MGTTFRIVLYAPGAEHARRAADAAFARISRLDDLLSDYDADSELSRLSARSEDGPTGPIAVGPELLAVLARAGELAARTGGAFDVTVGPYVQLWRRARRQGELPEPRRLAAAASSVGASRLTVDDVEGSVTLSTRGMRLDLGAIAKGYALDEALAVLRSHGIERALVDGGGDIAAGAPPPGQPGWRVSIPPFTGEAPREALTLSLSHAALATSGDTWGSVVVEGVRHTHILDPRSGRALTSGVGASVLAADGMTADALASAACVLGPTAALVLFEAWPGVELRLVSGAGTGTAIAVTSGFHGTPCGP